MNEVAETGRSGEERIEWQFWPECLPHPCTAWKYRVQFGHRIREGTGRSRTARKAKRDIRRAIKRARRGPMTPNNPSKPVPRTASSDGSDFQRDLIVKQREVIHALIRAWPGGKDSVSFTGVARQVREVMGDTSIEWRDLGGPPPKGRCGYEQFEPDNTATPITEREALEGINAIRNSIVGAQTWNWSEHGYPLVSLLDRAGYEGLPYPEAKANVGTLIDRVAELEAELEAERSTDDA